MKVTIGTFNLNNLFGRWDFYAEIPQQPAATTHAAGVPDWLERAPAGRSAADAPDVKIVIEGKVTPVGIKWRTNPVDGKVVYRKTPEAQATLARRIKAMDVDVLAVQEVESIEALQQFVDDQQLDGAGYTELVLVEGNDQRLIDVGLISKLPIGPVTSWRHRTYENEPGPPVFSRDLLQVEILDGSRRRTLVTVYVNHLKSKLARSVQETEADNRRRRQQAETIAAILAERPPPGPYVVLGDMNDSPDSPQLAPIPGLGLTNALTDPDETGGPYPSDDPDPPTTTAWTHRFRSGGHTSYELFDKIWLSRDLVAKQTGAWIDRRTTRGGDGSDHDPSFIELDL